MPWPIPRMTGLAPPRGLQQHQHKRAHKQLLHFFPGRWRRSSHLEAILPQTDDDKITIPARVHNGMLAQQANSFSRRGAKSDCFVAAPKRTIADLTDDVMIYMFNIIATEHGPEAQAKSPLDAGFSFTWFRMTLPLVCRRWSVFLKGNGKYGWDSVILSVTAEHEAARKLQRRHATQSIPIPIPGGSFARNSREPPAYTMLSRAAVESWANARLGTSGAVQYLLLDFVSSYAHDFGSLEGLLRAANRGPRGLRVLRLPTCGLLPSNCTPVSTDEMEDPTDIGNFGLMEWFNNNQPYNGRQDSYAVLGRLKGLAELHVSGLPQGFLSGTLPHLSSLEALTQVAFTPGALAPWESQLPILVPSLPPNLRSLTLTELWLSWLPPLSSCAPHLTRLELSRCFLMGPLLASLASATALAALHLDGSSLTSSVQVRLGWGAPEAGRWPSCPGLHVLSLAGCGLCSLPTGLAEGCPRLELLDLSNNPDLGGAGGAPGGPPEPATSAACLSPELALLGPSLRELRLAGCGLTVLPTALAALTGLTALDLAHNALSALPLLQTPPASSSLQCVFTRVSNSAVWTAPLFGEALVRLNISFNRSLTVWPSGLAGCSRLRELVVGVPLVAGSRGAAEGEFERCVGALTGLTRLVVHGGSFDPRAVRALLAVQRMAATRGRPVVEVAAE